MGGNIRLGRALGIPIEINTSWFLVFFLVVWSLASQVFPTWQGGLGVVTYWALGVAAALVLFGSLLFHEMAHSLVSRRFGIEVRRITLFLFGGVSESPEEMPSPRAEFWIAIAGPVSSLALAAAFTLASRWAAGAGASPALTEALAWLGVVIGALALFNLIPGFPLDGGRVLRAAVWGATHDLERATRWASYGGQAFAVVLIGTGIARLVSGNWFGGLWLGFLGWLLFQAAQGSYTQVRVKQALQAVRVKDLMSANPETIAPEATLREAVEQHFMAHSYGGYPVVDEAGRLVGLLTRQQVNAVSPGPWDAVAVAHVMLPATAFQTLGPDDAVGDRLDALMAEGVGRLPVVEDGRVVGLLSQTDVIRRLTWAEGSKRPGG
jgi:Zn-dependent protease/predicted transcriptional regulator